MRRAATLERPCWSLEMMYRTVTTGRAATELGLGPGQRPPGALLHEQCGGPSASAILVWTACAPLTPTAETTNQEELRTGKSAAASAHSASCEPLPPSLPPLAFSGIRCAHYTISATSCKSAQACLHMHRCKARHSSTQAAPAIKAAPALLLLPWQQQLIPWPPAALRPAPCTRGGARPPASRRASRRCRSTTPRGRRFTYG